MTAYYNEIDAYAARWMQNLITAGHIAPGVVDTRSIKDVTPNDIRPYTQAHFFAGIAGWSHALRLAGWPDDRPVWTGSCPCQPFSTAGKRGGTDDARHLWPDWFRLIRECHPGTIFGEQVASKDGLAWLDLVYDDLESEGYAVAALDLCAAGIGAPHIRQRLYFVANTKSISGGLPVQRGQPRQANIEPERGGKIDILAHANGASPARLGQYGGGGQGEKGLRSGPGFNGNLGDTLQQGLEGYAGDGNGRDEPGRDSQETKRQTINAGFWNNLEWLPCRDGKARPTQPGLFPLAHGVPARVGRLRAYGNAIVPPLAAEFIRACMEVLG